MATRSSEKAGRNPEETRARLIEAAWAEFEEAGYDDTNTNRIAQRAGYAPQTFYRHFEHKQAIFLAVYAQWVEDEARLLDGVRDADQAARLAIRHHKRSLKFRRALRLLSVSDPAVRKARAESRLAQIARLRTRLKHLAKTDQAELAAGLLQLERLADACAEGEFADLGLTAAEGERALARVMRDVLGRR